MSNKILITGGAGYVGTVLTEKLLKLGYEVFIYDLCLYGMKPLEKCLQYQKCKLIKEDLRDESKLREALEIVDTVIHLACISNDPSFELNPTLGKSINYDASVSLIDLSVEKGIEKFIYASSSSVYGVKDVSNVTEDLALEPMTEYSKYKALIERYLERYRGEMPYVVIRPATVCGYSPRQRFDLVVNILTNNAINRKKIKVFGGSQMRPNIHIDDMTNVYVQLVKEWNEKVDGNVYNVGGENKTVLELAQLVNQQMDEDLEIIIEPTDDLRSYHISSEKIFNDLAFAPKKRIFDAISDLKGAFKKGVFENPLDNEMYFNIKRMKSIRLN